MELVQIDVEMPFNAHIPMQSNILILQTLVRNSPTVLSMHCSYLFTDNEAQRKVQRIKKLTEICLLNCRVVMSPLPHWDGRKLDYCHVEKKRSWFAVKVWGFEAGLNWVEGWAALWRIWEVSSKNELASCSGLWRWGGSRIRLKLQRRQQLFHICFTPKW